MGGTQDAPAGSVLSQLPAATLQAVRNIAATLTADPAFAANPVDATHQRAQQMAAGIVASLSASGSPPNPALGLDIAELCFIVLMEATNDQDQDLELIMAETKAQTSSKQALRALIAAVGPDVVDPKPPSNAPKPTTVAPIHHLPA
jgi:hypothetical protein